MERPVELRILLNDSAWAYFMLKCRQVPVNRRGLGEFCLQKFRNFITLRRNQHSVIFIYE